LLKRQGWQGSQQNQKRKTTYSARLICDGSTQSTKDVALKSHGIFDDFCMSLNNLKHLKQQIGIWMGMLDNATAILRCFGMLGFCSNCWTPTAQPESTDSAALT
jgi:hypothetical protein